MTPVTNVQVWRLHITGMTGAFCAEQLEEALRKLPGVLSAQVNLALGTAEVHTISQALLPDLIAAVQKAGYNAAEIQDGTPAAPPRDPLWWSTMLWVSIVASNILPSALESHHQAPMTIWLQLVIGTPMVIWLGLYVVKACLKAARRTSYVELLVVLGVPATFGLFYYLLSGRLTTL